MNKKEFMIRVYLARVYGISFIKHNRSAKIAIIGCSKKRNNRREKRNNRISTDFKCF